MNIYLLNINAQKKSINNKDQNEKKIINSSSDLIEILSTTNTNVVTETIRRSAKKQTKAFNRNIDDDESTRSANNPNESITNSLNNSIIINENEAQIQTDLDISNNFNIIKSLHFVEKFILFFYYEPIKNTFKGAKFVTKDLLFKTTICTFKAIPKLILYPFRNKNEKNIQTDDNSFINRKINSTINYLNNDLNEENLKKVTIIIFQYIVFGKTYTYLTKKLFKRVKKTFKKIFL